MMKKDAKEPIEFTPFNWLKDAAIYNQNFVKIPIPWIHENADIIALLFSRKGIDRNNIIKKFYSIYEKVKHENNIPIEVINVPFDETEEDFKESYKEQANWFTLRFDDILVPTLKYLYGITCIPHIVVMKTDCTIISSHGILDLELYGKNALLTWLTTSSSRMKARSFKAEGVMYGEVWKFAGYVHRRSITSSVDGNAPGVEKSADSHNE